MKDALSVAQRVCDRAGDLLVASSAFAWIDKQDSDPVTETDLLIESEMRELLSRLSPGVAVYGEEMGGGDPTSGTCWVVDPVDGTANFSLGSPWCGNFVALLVDGVAQLAVCNLPFLGERFHAVLGEGCFDSFSGERLGPFEDRSLDRSNIAVACLWNQRSRRQLLDFQLALMEQAFRYQVPASLCMETQLVLRGRAQGLVRGQTALHDLAAPWLLLHECGLGPYGPSGPPAVQPLTDTPYHVFAPPGLAAQLASLLP